MPISAKLNRKSILKAIGDVLKTNNLEQATILDLGIGLGNFGRLIKNKIKTKARIVGVEAWEKYRNPQWEYYDEIIIDHILSYLQNDQQKFDIILLIDVLEHLDKNDGLAVLNNIKNKANYLVVLAAPVTKYPQAAVGGNLYEKHRYFWSSQDLNHHGFKTIFGRWMPTFKAWPPFARLEVFIYQK